MSITISNSSGFNVISSTGTTNGVTLPSTPTAGNKIVYFVSVDKQATAFTPPSGFTARATVTAASVSMLVCEKTSDGTETGSIAATWTTARVSKAIVFEVSTSLTTISYDTVVQNNSETASTSISTGSVTTGANAALGIVFVAKDSAKSNPGDPDPTVTWTNGSTTYDQNWTATAAGDTGAVVASRSVNPSSSVSETFSHTGSSDQLAIAMLTFAEVGAGVTITSTSDDTPTNGSTLTINGSGFEANQGTGGVTAAGVGWTETNWNATAIQVTVALGDNKYNTNVSLVVTNNSSQSSSGYNVQIQPASGYAYTNLSGTLASSGDRITAISDLASGDQLEYYGVTGGSISDVTVNADASFSWNPGVTGFYVRANDGTGWGTAGWQDTTPPAESTENPYTYNTRKSKRVILA